MTSILSAKADGAVNTEKQVTQCPLEYEKKLISCDGPYRLEEAKRTYKDTSDRKSQKVGLLESLLAGLKGRSTGLQLPPVKIRND